MKLNREQIDAIQKSHWLVRDIIRELTEENERLMAEKEAAVDDLEHCMYYAKPKNNNTCNFCLNDCESGLCKGREDWIKCRPVWRGIVKAKGDVDQIAQELLEEESDDNT